MSPIYIVFLVYIWEVILSADVTSFPRKNGFVISYTIGRLVQGKGMRPAGAGGWAGIDNSASTKELVGIEGPPSTEKPTDIKEPVDIEEAAAIYYKQKYLVQIVRNEFWKLTFISQHKNRRETDK